MAGVSRSHAQLQVVATGDDSGDPIVLGSSEAESDEDSSSPSRVFNTHSTHKCVKLEQLDNPSNGRQRCSSDRSMEDSDLDISSRLCSVNLQDEPMQVASSHTGPHSVQPVTPSRKRLPHSSDSSSNLSDHDISVPVSTSRYSIHKRRKQPSGNGSDEVGVAPVRKNWKHSSQSSDSSPEHTEDITPLTTNRSKSRKNGRKQVGVSRQLSTNFSLMIDDNSDYMDVNPQNGAATSTHDDQAVADTAATLQLQESCSQRTHNHTDPPEPLPEDADMPAQARENFRRHYSIAPSFHIDCVKCCWTYLTKTRKYSTDEGDPEKLVKFGYATTTYTHCYVDGPKPSKSRGKHGNNGPKPFGGKNGLVRTSITKDPKLGEIGPRPVEQNHSYQMYYTAPTPKILGMPVATTTRIEAISVHKLERSEVQGCCFSYADVALLELYRRSESKEPLKGQCCGMSCSEELLA